MIVFLAGMQRSGSTFSFNVARELLEWRGQVYQEPLGLLLPVLERSGTADHVLIKGHGTDEITTRLAEVGAMKVICTVRKPEDAIASWQETFGFDFEQSIASIEAWLAMFARIKRQALVIDYDEIDRHPFEATSRIAAFLTPDASVEEITQVSRKWAKAAVKEVTDKLEKDREGIRDIGFSYFDTKTFFHRKHVSTLESRGAAERIGDDAVRQIRERLAAHLDGDGNLRLG